MAFLGNIAVNDRQKNSRTRCQEDKNLGWQAGSPSTEVAYWLQVHTDSVNVAQGPTLELERTHESSLSSNRHVVHKSSTYQSTS